jgi:hypothetical protein
MASPWKFLERLTSRWRGSKEQLDGVTDDVNSEEAVSPEPVDAAATDNTQNSSDRLVEREQRPADRSDADMTVRELSAKAASRLQGKVDLESARPVGASDPGLSDDADARPTRDAPTYLPSQKRLNAKRKRSQKARLVKSVEVIPQQLTSVLTFSDEVQSLDAGIGLLRDQLARKLQLQNAQLRMMLERFDR